MSALDADTDARRRVELAVVFTLAENGRARAAFGAGDRVFQVDINVLHTKTYVIPMSRAGTAKFSSDPTEILNSVCNEGWRIVNGSFVFLETGSESRDKFMRSGQDIAVQGTVVGYYAFERDESMLTSIAHDTASGKPHDLGEEG